MKFLGLEKIRDMDNVYEKTIWHSRSRKLMSLDVAYCTLVLGMMSMGIQNLWAIVDRPPSGENWIPDGSEVWMVYGFKSLRDITICLF